MAVEINKALLFTEKVGNDLLWFKFWEKFKKTAESSKNNFPAPH